MRGDRGWGESGNKINGLHLGERGRKREKVEGWGVGGGEVAAGLRADLASHPWSWLGSLRSGGTALLVKLFTSMSSQPSLCKPPPPALSLHPSICRFLPRSFSYTSMCMLAMVHILSEGGRQLPLHTLTPPHPHPQVIWFSCLCHPLPPSPGLSLFSLEVRGSVTGRCLKGWQHEDNMHREGWKARDGKNEGRGRLEQLVHIQLKGEKMRQSEWRWCLDLTVCGRNVW